MWRAFVKSGDIFRKKYRGLYCVGHEAFVMEKDLVGGVCEDHQKAPEVIEEENWFFRLSKYAKEIESRIKHHELLIIPETRKNEILSFIEQGLEDVSFFPPRKGFVVGSAGSRRPDADHVCVVRRARQLYFGDWVRARKSQK